MLTPKKRKPRKFAERKLITFIICILLIGCIIGGSVVGIIAAAASNSSSTPYGTRDGKTLTDDGVLIVKSEEFTPLECGLSEELQEYTFYLCQAYYMDFEFVMALMYTESAFKADVISGTNDYGLMQLNTCNHKELTDKLGITDFTEPYQNIRGGVYLLRRLFEKYDEPALVCMAYNMGEYGASVLWDNGVYETAYSNKVLSKANEYAAEADNAK